MEVEQVLDSARKAKKPPVRPASVWGRPWKNPHERDMPYLEQIVQGGQSDGAGNLYDARHVEREPGAASG
ncbi:biotin synthetase [Salmonella enterica subsp. enterica]|uniref:Biotin synthetase n=1 Tax=Salmonella enterica I TaxID=59201 RepID=A0A379VU69_SALET|nr:biotin synthetase [Salmonella enterica subsp. enterica]